VVSIRNYTDADYIRETILPPQLRDNPGLSRYSLSIHSSHIGVALKASAPGAAKK
jgi:hypothetical protein